MRTEKHIYGSSRLGMDARAVDMFAAATATDNGYFEEKRGEKRYELSNHLGNVLVVLSDQKLATLTNTNTLDYYTAEVLSYNDYYPPSTSSGQRFGAPMHERSGTNGGGEYRYGFNGMELDDEVHGKGNSINYKYRMHDPRLGRFFAVDQLVSKYPWNSPYAFSENKVIHAVELEGREAYIVVFPDYKISTPLGKIPGLGHAGSLIINPSTGDAYYIEYGRYDSNVGNARVIGGSHKVGTVQFGEDGFPTVETMSEILGVISDKAGNGGRIETAEFCITQEEFNEMLKDQQEYLKEANDPDRKPYKLTGADAHNCGTVACEIVSDNTQGKNIPEEVNARPVKMIQEVLEAADANRVGYNPESKATERGGEYVKSQDEIDTDMKLEKKEN